MRRAKQMVRSMYAAAAELEDDDRRKLTKWALASESEGRLRAAVSLAETERAPLGELVEGEAADVEAEDVATFFAPRPGT